MRERITALALASLASACGGALRPSATYIEPCPGDTTLCTLGKNLAYCADTEKDLHNCGFCQAACGPGQLCEKGACVGCGNGVLEPSRGETCEDGNAVDGDGCDHDCREHPFHTLAPVQVSGALSCTTGSAAAARAMVVEKTGVIAVVVTCNDKAYWVTSVDYGRSYSPPIDLSHDPLHGPAHVTLATIAAADPRQELYVGLLDAAGTVWATAMSDHGAGELPLTAVGHSPGPFLSIQPREKDIWIGWREPGGVHLDRINPSAESVAPMPAQFADLVYDASRGLLALCGADDTFRVRRWVDGGRSFSSEFQPIPTKGQFSNCAIGDGRMFVAQDGELPAANHLYVISTRDMALAADVPGLPGVAASSARAVAADARGNAYVGSQVPGRGIEVARLESGHASFDSPFVISPRGALPQLAPLPAADGVAVAFTMGHSVYVAIQSY